MADSTTPDHPLRERRLRRRAAHLGLCLRNSRTRLRFLPETGRYMLVDRALNTEVASGNSHGYGLTLDEIEAALTEDAA